MRSYGMRNGSTAATRGSKPGSAESTRCRARSGGKKLSGCSVMYVTTERSPLMHPTLMHEIARYEQADRLRKAEQARLAHEVRRASDTPQRWFRLQGRHRVAALGRPVFSR
jgi:hypothetical protein